MINLANKNALITGGSKGIGAACVKMFSAAECNVAFTYNRSEKEADFIVNKYRSRSKILALKCDVTKESSIIETVRTVAEQFSSLDILVNNAGIWQRGEIENMSLMKWEEMLRTNLTSAYLFSREAIPLMKSNSFGRIINISSTAGQRGESNYSHYAASKGGMISLTKSLASEVGQFGITVNSVAPGWVFTPMTEEIFADAKYLKLEENKIPVGRIASAEDIAGPVLFLASELARHINGEILNVNGGSVLCG